VIEDPYNGSRSDREIFADSGWHLTEESAEERSQIIGRFLTTFEKLER